MIEKITKIICAGECINEELVFSKTRESKIIYARQLIQYFCYEFKAGSYKFIGEQTGYVDHSTVTHSCEVIKNYIETDRIKSEKINLYRKKIIKSITVIPHSKMDKLSLLIERLEKKLFRAKKKLSEYQNIYQNQRLWKT